jgi:hypothetical protein
LDANCPQPTTYYADTDKDGFGDAKSSVKACHHPAGYSTNDDDCYDSNADAHPGQTTYFYDDRGDGSWDYNCDGTDSAGDRALMLDAEGNDAAEDVYTGTYCP